MVTLNSTAQHSTAQHSTANNNLTKDNSIFSNNPTKSRAFCVALSPKIQHRYNLQTRTADPFCSSKKQGGIVFL